MYKSLYIHIPFCKKICTYCDFVREINSDDNIKKYINKIIKEIDLIENKLDTIYIGGGTPNSITNELLENLLFSFQNKIHEETEFTIELNPDLVTEEQVLILKKNNINRVSLGVQSTNNKILKEIGRDHTIEMTITAIKILQKNDINNINCDFIYNLPNMTLKDVDDIIFFINKNDIKHISFYSLEIKDGSILNKLGYTIDENIEEVFLEYFLSKITFNRYEVSNWSITKEYESKHNKSYWNMKNWKGIGYGSFGFIDNFYIKTVGSSFEWKYEYDFVSELEQQKDILIMGLRQKEGISLKIKKNRNAFNKFKHLIPSELVSIKNDILKANNIDLLNEILITII